MATCPRCYGPLNEHHKCRPRWVRRLIVQALVITLFALVGVLVSVALFPHVLPVMGLIVGGAIGYGVSVVTRGD